MMTQDAAGRLYLADGPEVQRLDLRTTTGGKVPQHRCRVGWAKEEAMLLSASADGSLLEIGRLGGGTLHSLAGICLRRCATFLCN